MKIKKKLKKTQKEIKKTQKEIKKTQEEINVKINETQGEFREKLTDIRDLIERRGGFTILLRASYKGVLKKDEYQFSIFGRGHYASAKGWYLMPYNGRIEKIVLKTPYDYRINRARDTFRHDTLITSFIQIQVRKNRGEILPVKTYLCNLFYVEKLWEKPDPLKDEVKQIIIYDNHLEHYELDRNIFLREGDEIGIQTVLPYPKAYEFLKNGNNEYLLDLFVTMHHE